MDTKVIAYKSLFTGKEYSWEEYSNHGYGGLKHGKKDLPKDEYPYTYVYGINNTKNIYK